MSDSHCIQIQIKSSVLEFSAIVTSDVLDLDAIVVHGSIGEASEDILHFSLVENYMHPGISRVIINNYEAIKASSSIESRVMSGTEKIHVKQFEGSSNGHDCLRGMFCPRHLPCFTGTAQVIFLELDALDAYDMLLL